MEKAQFVGEIDFPVVHSCNIIPNKLISFSKIMSSKDTNQWVHFYEDDYLFERLWRNPKRYLPILKKFNGVILPDFSVYRDMPFAMQLWNIYRSKAIGAWLNHIGINVIPNVRFGDERTSQICCLGLRTNSVVSIGSNGAIKNLIDRTYFVHGVLDVVRIIKPKAIVFYGSVPSDLSKRLCLIGVDYYIFECESSIAHRRA